jgi:hypothetical protein
MKTYYYIVKKNDEIIAVFENSIDCIKYIEATSKIHHSNVSSYIIQLIEKRNT